MDRLHLVGLAGALAVLAKIGCGGSTTSGTSDATDDASNDAGEEDAAAAAVDCGVAQNDPRCPSPVPGIAAAYGSGQVPCSPIGLTCSYPNAGDCCLSNGCYFTAQLWCAGDAGAESGHWFGAQ